MRRPWAFSQWSDCARSSSRLWAAKNAGPIVRWVSSSEMAFAPFSQNSAIFGLSGLGQAQLWQSKPSCLLTARNARSERTGPIARSPYFIVLTMAGIPAAAL